MHESTLRPPPAAPADPDLAEQARPGHGVPSKDSNPDAQAELSPAETVRLHIEDSGGSGRPVVLIRGDADAVVPFEGSGLRTHRAMPHSKLVTVSGAPHGLNVSHAPAFNDARLTFLLD